MVKGCLREYVNYWMTFNFFVVGVSVSVRVYE